MNHKISSNITTLIEHKGTHLNRKRQQMIKHNKRKRNQIKTLKKKEQASVTNTSTFIPPEGGRKKIRKENYCHWPQS
jgi:hypothetical protein